MFWWQNFTWKGLRPDLQTPTGGNFWEILRKCLPLPVNYIAARPLDQLPLLYDLNPKRLAQQHRLRRVEAQVKAKVKAGWGKLRPSLLGWVLLDDLNTGLRQFEGWSSVRFWPSQWTLHCIAIHDSTVRLRQAYKAGFQLDFYLHSEHITV